MARVADVSNHERKSLAARLRARGIADTGCGLSMGNHSNQYESGSLHKHACGITGANGKHTTQQRGTLSLLVERKGPEPHHNGFARIRHHERKSLAARLRARGAGYRGYWRRVACSPDPLSPLNPHT